MSSFEKHYAGLDITAANNNGRLRPISRVTLYLDDKNVVTAGDDTGLEISASCPNATQALVNSLLSRFRGFTYQAMSADDTAIDPAVELGDGITANGMYSVVARISDDGSGYMSVEAPGEQELEDEYPMDGPITRALTQATDRKIAETRSEITKTAEEIRLEVSTIASGLSASIQVNADAIEQRVTKNGVIAAINLSPEQATIKAGKISLEGLVTVNGTFRIDTNGYLQCTGGRIGGWTISDSEIYNGISYSGNKTTNSTGMGLTGYGMAFWAGDGKFEVHTDGYLHAENADITGTVNANAGVFNRVTINDSSLGGTLNAGGTFTGTHSGGSLSSTGGSFTGTHSGGSLNGTGGSFYGGHYSGVVNSCNLGGTSLSMTSGGSSNISTYSNGVRMYGSSNAHVVAGSVNLSLSSSRVYANTNFHAAGNITCDGSKNRSIKTEHFGTRLLDAFETPLPTFSDYGVATLDENGVFYIIIDPIFAETVNKEYLPTVFLTKYGEGDIWVKKIEHDTITVHGTPGMRFAWETRYAQTNARAERLRAMDDDYMDMDGESDFDGDAAVAYEHSAESIDYALMGYEYFTDFERSLTA